MAHARRNQVLATGAVIALAITVAGCGSDGGSGSASGQSGSGKGTLTVLHYYDEGAGALKDLVPLWEKRFEKAHKGVDVKFEYVPYDQMNQKVISAAAAGKGYDVILPTGVWLPEMIKAGAVQPIDDRWDSFADKGQFPKNTQGAGVFEDKRYAVQAFTNVEGVFYNKKILDKIGVEVPTDLDELEAAMAKAKKAGFNPLATAAPPGASGEFNLVPWLVSNGWSYEEPDNDGGAEILKRIQKWRDDDFFSPNDASGNVAEKNFTTGKYAFAQGGNWNLGTFKDDLKFEWGAAVVDGIDGALLGGEVLAVGAKAKDPELAWSFIEETFMSPQGGKDFAKAGSIPLREDAKELPAVTEDPNLKAFSEIAANSVSNPVNENTAKISDVIGAAWNEFVAGKISADKAFQRIADGVPPLMK